MSVIKKKEKKKGKNEKICFSPPGSSWKQFDPRLLQKSGWKAFTELKIEVSGGLTEHARLQAESEMAGVNVRWQNEGWELRGLAATRRRRKLAFCSRKLPYPTGLGCCPSCLNLESHLQTLPLFGKGAAAAPQILRTGCVMYLCTHQL